MDSVEVKDCVFCEHLVIDRHGCCSCSLYGLSLFLLPRETHCYSDRDKRMDVSIVDIEYFYFS